jgi:hypothetical protein
MWYRPNNNYLKQPHELKTPQLELSPANPTTSKIGNNVTFVVVSLNHRNLFYANILYWISVQARYS